MLLRKQFSRHQWNLLTKPNSPKLKQPSPSHFLLLFVSLSTFSLSLYLFFPPANIDIPPPDNAPLLPPSKAACRGGMPPFYMYDLPPEFNSGLLKDCSKLNIYTDMCPHVANHGLGQPLSAAANWYATHQFLAEMIFHGRLKNHPCRTSDPADARLFYVPFYGGLHASSKFREANLTARDDLAVRLIDFLVKQPWWRRNHGKDHFVALGRTAWDFMRTESGPDFGANIFLNLPPVRNMSVLTVERQPWEGHNQFGIPYASYFHPSTSLQMSAWKYKIRMSHRAYLFSFIGGPRKGVAKAAVRDELIRQCNESTRCMLLKCGSTEGNCHSPLEVVKVMSRSEFCLQAPGDSFTRRSTFDSILSGCIPVFMSPHTAYTQYSWYLPADGSEYSVYIDESEVNKGKNIEEELMKLSKDKVERMRSRIIELIPRITYAHPNATSPGFKDAVDVAVEALANHVQTSTLPLGIY